MRLPFSLSVRAHRINPFASAHTSRASSAPAWIASPSAREDGGSGSRLAVPSLRAERSNPLSPAHSPLAGGAPAWIASLAARDDGVGCYDLLRSQRSRSVAFGEAACGLHRREWRSEEHTSELQSLMRISYAVFCLKKKKHNSNNTHI